MRTRTVALLALTVPFVAEAAAPPLVPVTGYLTDDAGTPIDGNTTLHLKLYPAASGPTTLWTETQDVDVVNGQFTVYLGDQSALGLDLFRDNATVFLGMTVGTGAEMSPRFEVATSPFAAYAQYCDDAERLGGLDASEYRLVTDPVQWSDLLAVPNGLADGDADTTYTAGTALTLTGTTFNVNQATVDGWARTIAYDSLAELRTDLDGIYAAKMTCTPSQVLMVNGTGAWVCTDSTALPLSESVIDNFIANNGYATDAALTALTTRVGLAEGNISTLQTGLAGEITARTTAVSAEATARANADTTLTTGLSTEVTARTAAVAAEVTARTTAVTAEATARAAADTTLTTNLNAEVTARTSAVSAEATARTAADTALSSSLSTPGTFNAAGNPVDWSKLKNVPKVIYNLGTASQNGVLSTTVWADVPGATVNVTIPAGATLRLRSNGGVHAPGPLPYTHCGFRFVIDGTPYGDGTWGDVITGVNVSGSGSAYWEAWSIQRDVPSLTAGTHTVNVQMTGWGASYSPCYMDGNSYSAAKLIVEGF